MTEERALMITPTLYLVEATLPPTLIVAPQSVHHIVVLDCSGSMADVLPDIAEQLKLKLVALVRPMDTVSIIWFSGRGQCGILVKGEPIASLLDLQSVHNAIDRWLKPVGLTGFVEPLLEVGKLAKHLQDRLGGVSSLLFMSDGYDNQWSKSEILKAANNLDMASVTFCEFGYNADRAMLAEMAARAGGNLIFAQDFKQYAPQFEATLMKNIQGAPKRELTLGAEPIEGFVYALDSNGTIITGAVEDNKALLPGHIERAYYLTASPAPNRYGFFNELAAVYAGISLYAMRMKPNVVLPLLKNTGDARLINMFGNCFGKKAYSDFMQEAAEAAFNPERRLLHGYNPALVPDPNAFTLLDLLATFTEEDRVVIDHPEFEYTRISRQRVNADTVVTAAEIAEIKRLSGDLENNADQLKTLGATITAIANKQPMKFSKDKVPNGYPYDVTYNGDRPNINLQVKMYGTVALPPDAPEGLISPMTTFIYRKFSIVRDGIPNVPKLVMNLTPGTSEKIALLVANNVLSMGVVEVDERGFLIFDLNQLPIINQAMVDQASAKDLFEKSYELVQWKAAAKVYNGYKNELFPRQSRTFVSLYGDSAAKWLESKGLTDYNGFSPKTEKVESEDYYMGKTMPVSLKQISAKSGRLVEVDVVSTTINEAKKQMITGTFTPAGKLMALHIGEVERFLTSADYLESSEKDLMLEEWLYQNAARATSATRRLTREIAQIKFAVIVGQSWFKEFTSLDENSMDIISTDGFPIHGTVEMSEVQVKI